MPAAGRPNDRSGGNGRGAHESGDAGGCQAPLEEAAASGERFSFRWGVSLLDEGFTPVPNFLFRYYAAAGIKRHEFLLVLHLASYRYELEGSECRPAVRTVAGEMDYGDRRLQDIMGEMESRGLLTRRYRPGDTTIYEFSGMVRAILAARERDLGREAVPACAREAILGGESQFTPEPQFTPTPEPRFTPGVNLSSPEEEQSIRRQKEQVVGDETTALRQCRSLLDDIGVREPTRSKLVGLEWVTPQYLKPWAEWFVGQEELGVGWVVQQIRAADPPPSRKQAGNSRALSLSAKLEEHRRELVSQPGFET